MCHREKDTKLVQGERGRRHDGPSKSGAEGVRAASLIYTTAQAEALISQPTAMRVIFGLRQDILDTPICPPDRLIR